MVGALDSALASRTATSTLVGTHKAAESTLVEAWNCQKDNCCNDNSNVICVYEGMLTRDCLSQTLNSHSSRNLSSNDHSRSRRCPVL